MTDTPRPSELPHSATCSSCGAANPAGQRFCGDCGAALSQTCPACGASSAPGQRFCGDCGVQLAGSAATSAAAATTAALGGPAAPPAARRSVGPLGSEGALAGGGAAAAATAERRLVSILFADLVGFTPFAEERDAEDVRDTLTRYFDLATDVITSHGGSVEKFIGDAVMAVWGTPTAREDDAERAVRAALELVTAVRTLGGEIQARAAVLTGEAAVTIGALNQGMVAGDLVNTAARLQGVAAPGWVLVGEATHRLASDSIAFEAVGEQSLKGKVSPVPAWRALRVVAERGGRRRADALEAPFVGRDDDLRLIKDLYHATVREQRIRLVSVTGVGGSGKSRLAWEFEKYIDGIVGTTWWHHGRSPAYGEGITFWALGEMIRQRARLAETDDEPTTRRKLAEMVAAVTADEREATWLHAAFLALLGIEAGRPDELFGAWRTFFERMAASGPVVLVFEDLHWADSGTLDFIDHLLEWSRTVPIYIVTLARPELLEKRPTWGAGRRSFTSLSLEPLPEAAVREILAQLVPGLPESTMHAIIDRAEGVPLYAIETIRMLVDDGTLAVRPDGTYELAGDVTELAVPPTLTALIAARLDALEAPDRVLVLDAAVLGQSFTTAGLAGVAGLAEDAVESRLHGLVRNELIARVADPLSPERGQYGFVQALVREVAYNTLSKKDRKTRHLAAARFFEGLGADEMAGALAGHYLAAHRLATEGPEQEALAAQARLALRGAAERAASLGAHDQAVSFYNEAMSVATDKAEAAELLERAGEESSVAAHAEDAERYLREAVRLHRERGDLIGLARAGARLGRALLVIFRVDLALEVLTQVAAEVADLRETPDGIAIDMILARAHWLRDEPQTALQITDRVLALAERLDLVPIVAETMLIRGGSLCDMGRTYEGLAVMDGAVRLADSQGLVAIATRGRNSLMGYLAAREPRAAAELAQAGLAEARRVGDRATVNRMIANASEVWLWIGEWPTARHEIDELLGGSLGREDRLFGLGNRAILKAYVGEEFSGDLTEIETLVAGELDGNVANVASGTRAAINLASGAFQSARLEAMLTARLSPFNAPPALSLAGHAAAWDRDLAALEEVLQLHIATAAHGGNIDLRRAAMAAGIAALQGRREEAVNSFRDSIEGLRSLDSRLEWVMTVLDLVATVGPTALPEAVQAARSELARLNATTLLERLEALIASQPRPAQRRTSAIPATEQPA
ncbi:MAG TPA: adenylate/guanylate cyclase domain-containing protein [Candidatus Limnocylindria bacterium]|nr:adenylate/guanylate cyclase domain-containing protein [Candidatus Limnocylindria bacterium]